MHQIEHITACRNRRVGVAQTELFCNECHKLICLHQTQWVELFGKYCPNHSYRSVSIATSPSVPSER